jgi:hypothetical protein
MAPALSQPYWLVAWRDIISKRVTHFSGIGGSIPFSHNVFLMALLLHIFESESEIEHEIGKQYFRIGLI